MLAITNPKLAPSENKHTDIKKIMAVPLRRPAKSDDSSMPVETAVQTHLPRKKLRSPPKGIALVSLGD